MDIHVGSEQLRSLEVDIAQLRGAFDPSTDVGKATALFMNRYGIDATRAFSILVRMSRAQNRPVQELAAAVVNVSETLPLRVVSGPVR